MANQGKIDRGFKDAGWELDGGFMDHLVIGHDGNLSILANPRLWDGAYELYNVESHLACWVREIPTPQRAKELIKERGEPPEGE